MEKQKYDAGTPSWVDIGVPDIDAACEFYGGLFGWTFDDMGPEMGGYRLAKLRGKNVAGIGNAQRSDVPPFWTTYITVDDIETTAKAVEAAGGKQLGETMSMEGVSKVAVFLDSTGAQWSGWEPWGAAGAELINEPGAVSWNELATRDPEEAKKFYSAVLDWKADAQDMGGRPYTTWMSNGSPVGGMFQMDDTFPKEMGPCWMTYFAVESRDTSAEKLQSLGGKVERILEEIPGVGKIAIVSDPQGGAFALFQMDPQLLQNQ